MGSTLYVKQKNEVFALRDRAGLSVVENELNPWLGGHRDRPLGSWQESMVRIQTLHGFFSGRCPFSPCPGLPFSSPMVIRKIAECRFKISDFMFLRTVSLFMPLGSIYNLKSKITNPEWESPTKCE